MRGETATSTAGAAEFLNNLAGLIENDPTAAADELENMAGKLTALAAKLRESARSRDPEGPPRSTGGTDDRVQMNVVGPDGRVKQRSDTYRRV